MKKFRSGLDKFTHGVQYVSLVAVLFAMMITTIDVILSLTTKTRILGNMELVELAMVIMMFLSFGTTQMENGHVRVDMFVNKFPPKGRCLTNAIIQCVCAIFGVLLTIQSFKQISILADRGASTAILHIPQAPFAFIMFIGFAIYTVTIILTALEYFAEIPNAKPLER